MDTHDPAHELLREAAGERDASQYDLYLSAIFTAELGDPHSTLSHLRSEARLNALNALSELISVDAENPKTIRELQNTILRMQDLDNWIADALVRGEAAQQELEAEQRINGTQPDVVVHGDPNIIPAKQDGPFTDD